jgi:alpha-tubulin suppressor-like RCC1 family protein
LDSFGNVYSFGKGKDGQLGYIVKYDEGVLIGNQQCQSTPKKIPNLNDICDIFSGRDFSFALDNKGDLYSWGNNNHCQLARDINTKYDYSPQKAIEANVKAAKNLQKICLGWMHGMLMDKDGNVFVWGNPFFDYDKNFEPLKEPILVKLPHRAIDIACGFHHFVTILLEENTNEVYTWGANDYGQLGYETKDSLSLEPTKVNTYGYKPKHVYCGAFHSMVLFAEAKIFGFGHN